MPSLDLITQLSASGLSIAGSWLYGNKSMWGPGFGLVAQVPWWIIMVHGSMWGLLPVNLMMLVTHVRNLWKWNKETNG